MSILQRRNCLHLLALCYFIQNTLTMLAVTSFFFNCVSLSLTWCSYLFLFCFSRSRTIFVFFTLSFSLTYSLSLSIRRPYHQFHNNHKLLWFTIDPREYRKSKKNNYYEICCNMLNKARKINTQSRESHRFNELARKKTVSRVIMSTLLLLFSVFTASTDIVEKTR